LSQKVRCAFDPCTTEGIRQCGMCGYLFCARHIDNHDHGGSKGRGVGIQ